MSLSLLERIFGTKRTKDEVPPSFEARLRALDAEQEKQGRALKALQLEWEEVYDKVMHLMARITKRQKALDRDMGRAEAQEAAGEATAAASEAQPSIGVGTHSRLQEMRRRNGLLPR